MDTLPILIRDLIGQFIWLNNIKRVNREYHTIFGAFILMSGWDEIECGVGVKYEWLCQFRPAYPPYTLSCPIYNYRELGTSCNFPLNHFSIKNGQHCLIEKQLPKRYIYSYGKK